MNSAFSTEKSLKDLDRIFFVFFAVLIAVQIALVVILSWVPPVSRDALIQHLAVPKLYLRHGGMYEIPFLKSSYYPMNLDLLYLIPLYFGNDIIPKLIHFSFGLFTAIIIFFHLNARIKRNYAILGSLLFLSVPVIVRLSITVYVDLGLIFFSTASLLLLINWLNNRFRYRDLVFAAVLCGLGLGTKYNGLIIFLILTFFILYIYSRYGREDERSLADILFAGSLFVAVSILVFSPWLARNYIWTGNPIFPLFDGFFNPGDAVSGRGLDPFTVRRLLFNENWWEMALLPLRIFFQGQDGNPQYFDGRLNPFLLIFPLFLFWRKKNQSHDRMVEIKILLAFAVLYFLFVFLKAGIRMRYISPVIPPLVILSVYGIHNALNFLKSTEKKTVLRTSCLLMVLCMVILSFLLNGSYILGLFKEVAPLTYLNGSLSRDEYILKYRPEYGAIRYINENLNDNVKILFIFVGRRGYYCSKDYLAGIEILEGILKKAGQSNRMSSAFCDRGITHLLVRHDLFSGWLKNKRDKHLKALMYKMLQNKSKLVYYNKGYGLYEIKDTKYSPVLLKN